ncbi:MAG: MmcQ/YjbR family DNA-binding protein [Candidatus Sulfopaludibacter sp.]|nr:MmcQ/YjbR family DNA-binding protein [Candidatus Sulfopaludibacter sp.]
MAQRKVNFDIVRKIGRAFPGVEESTCFGQPALKVGGRMFTCLASHHSAEPGSLVVRVDFSRRQELLAEAPDVYYLTSHYVDYPGVLVRLERIQPDALHGLLAGALQFVQTERSKRPPRKISRRQ